MRYYVTLEKAPDAKPLVVDVRELPSGGLDVMVDGAAVPVDVVSFANETRALSVRVDGRMVDLTTEGEPPEIGAIASGHRSYVRVESERQRAAAAAKKGGSASSEKTVKSPMPGRVIRLLVAKGDEVAAGQTLCVIEAMKMENEVKAKVACKVEAVHVSEGATVEANAKIFSLS
jgi:glutaconyl-CoA/methylmalonyl-CoA decarboxylase subunit gamma